MTTQKRKEVDNPPGGASSASKKPRHSPSAEPPVNLLGPHQEIIAELEPKYNILAASVISSTQIRSRISYATKHLLSDGAASAPVVLLHARLAEACKLITIVEQAKRVLKEEGKAWFQYNQMFELPPKKEKPEIVERTVLENEDGDDNSEEEDDGFEVMRNRFEKAALPQPSQRPLKSLRVFLSTIAIPDLRAKGDVTVQSGDMKTT